MFGGIDQRKSENLLLEQLRRGVYHKDGADDKVVKHTGVGQNTSRIAAAIRNQTKV